MHFSSYFDHFILFCFITARRISVPPNTLLCGKSSFYAASLKAPAVALLSYIIDSMSTLIGWPAGRLLLQRLQLRSPTKYNFIITPYRPTALLASLRRRRSISSYPNQTHPRPAFSLPCSTWQ